MSTGMNRNTTQALMIDLQERLLAAMPDPEKLVRNTEILLKGLRVLGIPVTVTQQYTRGLGDTDARLMEAGGITGFFDKISYSCLADDAVRTVVAGNIERKHVLLFGVESHICVWQTARDLLEAGFDVQVVCDCIASRKEMDREMALRRLEQAGAVLTTTEACLFELLERAGTPEFKEISRLIR